VAEATARNTSSMRQDIEADRRTEVDAINGAVAERGERARVATPVNDTLAALVRAWERERELRG
jgi:2-dehydropantoate 2-reductase